MPYTTPSTITTGQLVTATLMNNEWAGNISFLANPPACRVYNSTDISVPHITLTPMTFDSERFDTNSMHSTVSLTSRITFNTAGMYVVTFCGGIVAGTDYTMVSSYLRLNGGNFIGTQVVGTVAVADDHVYTTVTATYKFAVNDYVEAYVFHRNGAAAARSVKAIPNRSPEFSAAWIGLG